MDFASFLPLSLKEFLAPDGIGSSEPSGSRCIAISLYLFRTGNFYSPAFTDTTKVGQALFMQPKALQGWPLLVVVILSNGLALLPRSEPINDFELGIDLCCKQTAHSVALKRRKSSPPGIKRPKTVVSLCH